MKLKTPFTAPTWSTVTVEVVKATPVTLSTTLRYSGPLQVPVTGTVGVVG